LHPRAPPSFPTRRSSDLITFLVTLAPFVALQQWYGSAHAHASISGRFSNRLFDLDRWRWPLFFLVMMLVALMTIVPFVCLFVGRSEEHTSELQSLRHLVC